MSNGDSNGETTVQSIQRAAAILSMFSVARPRLSLAEITAEFGLSKATAHRYVSALRKERLLRLDPITGTYTLGTATLGMASAALAGLPVITVAEPVMEALVRDLQETVVLSVWDGDAPVVVRANSNTSRVVTVNIRTGTRLGPEAAQSMVFRAFGETSVHGKKSRRTGRPDEEAVLERIRRVGVAVRTNVELGTRTIAAPVFLGNDLAAVMAVLGTTATVPDDDESPHAKKLRAAVELIREDPRL